MTPTPPAADRPAEPGGRDREGLAALLATYVRCYGISGEALADAILASDWLRDHDAAVRAEAVRDGTVSYAQHVEVVERMAERHHRAVERGDTLAATVERVRTLAFSEQSNEFRREAAFGVTRLPYANNRYLRLLDDLRDAITNPTPGGTP